MFRSLLLNLLRSFAKAIIAKYHPEVVGVTGSIGKTSAKEAIARVLEAKFSVRKSKKNYNNEIGVPLAIIGVESPPNKSWWRWAQAFVKAARLLLIKDPFYPAILVLEMGADKPGDILYLIDIAPPKVGVLTFISPVHLEFFKTLKMVAQEKRAIISRLGSDGFAVLNYDNPTVMENAHVTKAETITYGLKEGADLRATDINMFVEHDRPVGLNFKVNWKGSIVPVFLPSSISYGFISAALAGLAVGTIFGINLVEAAAALGKLPFLPGHMRPLPGIKDSLIIDDTYNSSPVAAKVALETLARIEIPSGAERYAVLGDMLELGSETEAAHRDVGFKVAELGIDFLITVGEASKGTTAAAREAGLAEHEVVSFADSAGAGKFLQEVLEPGDVVLVKGSQGVRMERVVKEVMAEPEKAGELLVRQGDEWR